MKTKISRIGKSTLAVVLAIMLMLSTMLVGMISVNAVTFNNATISFNNATIYFLKPSSWTNAPRLIMGDYHRKTVYEASSSIDNLYKFSGITWSSADGFYFLDTSQGAESVDGDYYWYRNNPYTTNVTDKIKSETTDVIYRVTSGASGAVSSDTDLNKTISASVYEKSGSRFTANSSLASLKIAAKKIDGTASTSEVASYTSAKFQAPDVEGYEFLGWYNSSNGLVSNSNSYTISSVSSDTSLRAVYEISVKDWYLYGFFNGVDVNDTKTNYTNYKLEQIGNTNEYKIDIKSTSDLYLQFKNGTDNVTYGPNDYEDLTNKPNEYSQNAGTSGGAQKWGVRRPKTNLVITWNSATKKMKWALGATQLAAPTVAMSPTNGKVIAHSNGAKTAVEITATGTYDSAANVTYTLYKNGTAVQANDADGKFSVTEAGTYTVKAIAGNTDSYSDSEASSSLTVTVEQRYDATAAADLPTGCKKKVEITNGNDVASGTKVTAVVTVNNGYKCDGLSGITPTSSSSSGNTYTYEFNITGNVTVTPTVSKIEYNLTDSSDTSKGHVKFTKGGADVTKFSIGDVITFTAVAKDGYESDGKVTVKGTAHNSPYSMTITDQDLADINASANFSLKNYTITYNSTVVGIDSVTGSVSAAYGSEVTVTVTPEGGYGVSGITVGSQSITEYTKSGNDYVFKFTMPASNVTVTPVSTILPIGDPTVTLTGSSANVYLMQDVTLTAEATPGQYCKINSQELTVSPGTAGTDYTLNDNGNGNYTFTALKAGNYTLMYTVKVGTNLTDTNPSTAPAEKTVSKIFTVNATASDVQTAYNDLVTYYNSVKNENSADYTADSWTAFSAALASAKSLVDAGMPAYDAADTFTPAKTALETAYDGLISSTEYYIGGRFEIYDADGNYKANTNGSSGNDGWKHDSKNIKFEYVEKGLYKLETHADISKLSTNLGSYLRYFIIHTGSGAASNSVWYGSTSNNGNNLEAKVVDHKLALTKQTNSTDTGISYLLNFSANDYAFSTDVVLWFDIRDENAPKLYYTSGTSYKITGDISGLDNFSGHYGEGIEFEGYDEYGTYKTITVTQDDLNNAKNHLRLLNKTSDNITHQYGPRDYDNADKEIPSTPENGYHAFQDNAIKSFYFNEAGTYKLYVINEHATDTDATNVPRIWAVKTADLKTVTATVAPGANGVAYIKSYYDAEGNLVTNSNTGLTSVEVKYNTEVVFAARPNSGYVIQSWSGVSGTESSDKKTFTVSKYTGGTVNVSFYDPDAVTAKFKFHAYGNGFGSINSGSDVLIANHYDGNIFYLDLTVNNTNANSSQFNLKKDSTTYKANSWTEMSSTHQTLSSSNGQDLHFGQIGTWRLFVDQTNENAPEVWAVKASGYQVKTDGGDVLANLFETEPGVYTGTVNLEAGFTDGIYVYNTNGTSFYGGGSITQTTTGHGLNTRSSGTDYVTFTADVAGVYTFAVSGATSSHVDLAVTYPAPSADEFMVQEGDNVHKESKNFTIDGESGYKTYTSQLDDNGEVIRDASNVQVTFKSDLSSSSTAIVDGKSYYTVEILGYQIYMQDREGNKSMSSVLATASDDNIYYANYTFPAGLEWAKVTPIVIRNEEYLAAKDGEKLIDVYLIYDWTKEGGALGGADEPTYYVWNNSLTGSDKEPAGTYPGQKMLYLGNNRFFCRTSKGMMGILFSSFESSNHQTYDFDEYKRLNYLHYDHITFEIRGLDGHEVVDSIRTQLGTDNNKSQVYFSSTSEGKALDNKLTETQRNAEFGLDTDINGYLIDVFSNRLLDKDGNEIKASDLTGTTTTEKLTELLTKMGKSDATINALYGARYGDVDVDNTGYDMQYAVRNYFFNNNDYLVSQLISGYSQIENAPSGKGGINAKDYNDEVNKYGYFTAPEFMDKKLFSPDGYAMIPEVYKGLPYLVSYSPATKNGSTRYDGKWYYQRAIPQFTTKINVALADEQGKPVVTDGVISQNLNGLSAADVGSAYLNNDEALTEIVLDQGSKLTLNAKPGVKYDFVGFYNEDGSFINANNPFEEFVVANDDNVYAVFANKPVGSLTITNSIYRGSNPSHGGGTGNVTVKIVVTSNDGKVTTTVEGINSATANVQDGNKVVYIIKAERTGIDTLKGFLSLVDGQYTSVVGASYVDEDGKHISGTYTVTIDKWNWKEQVGEGNEEFKTIDFYSDFQKVSQFVTLNYNYVDRYGANKTYTVKDLDLTSDKVSAAQQASPKVLLDETIVKFAPAVGVFLQDCTWNIDKKSNNGSVYTLVANQADKNYNTYIDLKDGSAISKKVTKFNDVVHLSAPDSITVEGVEKTFSYWRQWDVDSSGNKIVDTDAIFSFRKVITARVTVDTYFEAVYGAENAPNFATSLTNAIYTRDTFTDASGNKVDQVITDYILTFVCNPTEAEKFSDLLLNENPNIKIGFVLEYDTKKKYDGNPDNLVAPTPNANILNSTIENMINAPKPLEYSWSAATDKTSAEYNYYYRRYDLSGIGEQLTNFGRYDMTLRFTNNDTNQKRIYNAYTYIAEKQSDGTYSIVAISNPRMLSIYAEGTKADGSTAG